VVKQKDELKMQCARILRLLKEWAELASERLSGG
jgi:hypothetical protein